MPGPQRARLGVERIGGQLLGLVEAVLPDQNAREVGLRDQGIGVRRTQYTKLHRQCLALQHVRLRDVVLPQQRVREIQLGIQGVGMFGTEGAQADRQDLPLDFSASGRRPASVSRAAKLAMVSTVN